MRRAGRSPRESPRDATRRSGPAPGGSGAAAMLAAHRLTGQAAPFGHARAALERYNAPSPPSRRPRRPRSRPRLRSPGPGPYSRCPTPSWRSSAAARRKGKERPRAPPPHVSHPAPPPAARAAIGCERRAIGGRCCQSPRAALGSGPAAPRGPARPAPVLPRALLAARPRLPAPITDAAGLPRPDRRASCA